MYYYRDRLNFKTIYVSSTYLDSTDAEYLGYFVNPNSKMVVASLYQGEEGYTLLQVDS